MRSKLFTLSMVLLISVLSYGQPLTGTKNIPLDYPSVTSAIAALNANGVGSGGVTFIVDAGYTETFTGLTNGLITATGTEADPIIFQKGPGSPNPVITGCTVGATGATDYVIAFQGSDYITFDGIDVTEPTGVIEWGYALLKESATNGSQHVTIKNCNIALKKSNTATIGIYSANLTTGGVTPTVTDLLGANSYNKFFSNSISGCYKGIVVNGFNDGNDPYQFQDYANEIGKDGGNTVTSQGGSTVTSAGIETSYQTRLFVSNNIINGTVNGAAICYGIYLNTARNATVDVVGNTITLQFADGQTNAFYGIYSNMGTIFTNNTLNVNNNTVTGCTYVKPTSGNFFGIHVTHSAQVETIAGNQITSNTYGNNGTPTTATGTIYGLYTSGAPTVSPSLEVAGNTITGFNRIQSAIGAGGNNYLYIIAGGSLSGPSIQIHDNVVANHICASTGTTYGAYVNVSTLQKICYNNTVENLTNSNGNIQGMYITESYSSTIYGNIVRNLETLSASTSAGYVYGIYAIGSSFNGPFYIYNNFISDLKAPNSATPLAVIGLNAGNNSMDYLGIWHNTIYLNNTCNGSNAGIIGMNLGSYPKQIDLRNNVVVNTAVPGSGGYAVAIRAAAYSATVGITNYSSVSNNNDFYVGSGPGNRAIAFITDGTNTAVDPTIESFKNRMWPRESNSFSLMPAFVNIAATPYDLHMDPATPTPCESSGLVISTPIAITSDYDNNPRYPNPGYPVNVSYSPVGPDLGADEFGGILLDQSAPAITYTPLQNTASMDVRDLMVSITDLSGIPQSGYGLPRLYWQINSGTWNSASGQPQGNEQYKFSFGEGVVLGDVINYYVVAQDNAATPNVGSFPFIGASGFSIDPPAATTPPATPSSYTIVQGLCGIKSVGVGKDYATLTAAMADLNSKALTCPVIFELYDATYTSPAETFPIFIDQVAGTSEVNTITIRPATGVTTLIEGAYEGVTGSGTYSLVSLRGAEHVIFDGSNSGGSDRSLTIRNTFPQNFAAAMGLYNNGRPAAWITVKNCILQAHADNVYNAQGIVCYTITGNGGYHDIIIDNNEINSTKFSVQIGGTASNPGYNFQVTNNLIGSMSSGQYSVQYGVYANEAANILIENNEIIGPAQGMNVPQSPTGVMLNGGLSNVKVSKNIIHDIWQTATPGPPYGSATGIYNASPIAGLEISDNVIYNVKAPGQSTSATGTNPMGIGFFKAGSNIKILHNTVVMQGNFMSGTTATANTCVYFHNNLQGAIDFRNNILVNTSQPATGTPASKTRCVVAGTNTIISTIDYNDYYPNGVGPTLGYYLGSDRTDLAAWKAATNQDLHSLSIDPVFTSATNMKPTTTAMTKAGIYLPSLPTDIVGIVRTNPPDIGAYEYGVMPAATTTAASDLALNGATLNGTVDPMDISVNVYFDYGLTTSYGTTVNGTPQTVSGLTPVNVSAPVTGLDEYTTYHFRLRIQTFSGVQIFGNDMTFTTLSSIPANIFASGTIVSGSQCFNALNTITVAGGGSTFEIQSGAIVTMIAGQKISFLPGTLVNPGAYLHAYIYDGSWCNTSDGPLAASVNEPVAHGMNRADFILYPNPTSGNVILEQRGTHLFDRVNVEVFNMQGGRIMGEQIIGEKSHELRFANLATGIYFVRIVADGYTETIKLVRL